MRTGTGGFIHGHTNQAGTTAATKGDTCVACKEAILLQGLYDLLFVVGGGRIVAAKEITAGRFDDVGTIGCRQPVHGRERTCVPVIVGDAGNQKGYQDQ
jgi:hypothetical protein